MDRTLVIECATPACSIALFEGEKLVANRHVVLGRGHAERLVPLIAELPDRGAAARILVSLGPGSFTGVRIGIAAARALGVAWKARVGGYPTHALLAATARAAIGSEAVGTAMLAGHGQWFVQNWSAGGLPQDALASLPPEDAMDRLRPSVIAGDAAEHAVAGRGYGLALNCLPDARHARAIPERLLSCPPAPIYGREPDATPQRR